MRPAIAPVFALAAVAACKGPPARIVAGGGDTVVVNNVRSVKLPVRVLDAAERPLDPTRVRYEWAAGALAIKRQDDR